MQAPPAYVRFGHAHNDLVALLEGLAGGNGPYGGSRVIFDAVTVPEHLPHLYADSAYVTEVRERATAAEKAKDDDEKKEAKEAGIAARKDVWCHHQWKISDLFTQARDAARAMDNDADRITRLNQINSLEICTAILASDLGFDVPRPTYRAALTGITGLEHAVIPTEQDLDRMRGELAHKLDRAGHQMGNFAEQVALWRSRQEIVPEIDFVRRYEELAQGFIGYIKEIDPRFPKEANVKVVPPDPSIPGKAGAFDYGRGGNFQGETYTIPRAGVTVPLLLILVAHEIGGHFRLNVLWDQYARETGDPFGNVRTMCAAETVVQEGISEQGILFYDKFIQTELVTDPKVIELEMDLHLLNRATLAYQGARKYSDQPMTPDEIREHSIAYGVLPSHAEGRAQGFVQRPDFLNMTYLGPAYYPGMLTVRQLMPAQGPDYEALRKQQILEAVRRPLTLPALSFALLESRT